MLWSESLVLFFPKLILCKLWHVRVKRTSFWFFHLVPFWWPNTRVSDRHEDPQLYEINLLSIVGHKQSSSKRDGLLISLPRKENYLSPYMGETKKETGTLQFYSNFKSTGSISWRINMPLFPHAENRRILKWHLSICTAIWPVRWISKQIIIEHLTRNFHENWRFKYE